MEGKKLTPWFRPDQKPARKGWYLRKYLGGNAYCHWNSNDWSCGVFYLEDWRIAKYKRSEEQALPWRGLAEQPK